MLAAEDPHVDFDFQGLSPPPHGRRESVASSRRNSRVLQNDLRLHEAVIKNEADTVEKILKEPVDVNSRNNYGRAPIHWASSRGCTDIMEMLINAKCDIEAQDKYGMRPLLMAAWHGHRQAAKLLVASGANVTAVSKKQYTVLMCAAKNNRKEVIDFLEETVEDLRINDADADSLTALHHAAAGGHVDTVRKLVQMGASIDCVDKENRTPLHCAAEKGHVEVVEFLLQKGASVSAQDNEGNAPLHLSAENKQTRVCEVLLQNGGAPDLPNRKGLTALHVASNLGCRGIIDSLLRHGSDINARTKAGNTPLHLACRNNEAGAVELLVAKGADVDGLNLRLESPIHLAAEKGFGEICQLLLAAGANIQQKEQGGKTPLYVAARGSFTAIVDMIIKTARLDYPSEDESETRAKGNVLKRVGRNWRQPNDKKNRLASDHNERLRNLLYKISYKHLEQGEWNRLAIHWAFTQEQIKAIEHQYAGVSSYKEHGFRMLLIWAHGLPQDVDVAQQLHEALVAIGNKKAADSLRKNLRKEKENDGKSEGGNNWACRIL